MEEVEEIQTGEVNLKKDHFIENSLCLIEECFIEKYKKLLQDLNPKMVIELGTYQGGFAVHLSEWLPDAEIYTIDRFWMIDKATAEILDKRNVTVIITAQVFNDSHFLPALLSLPIKKFLFCDNGYRVSEMKMFPGYLRPGDLLGVHDWQEDLFFKDIENVMGAFEEHPINKEIDNEPGLSCCRFWIKKGFNLSESDDRKWKGVK